MKLAAERLLPPAASQTLQAKGIDVDQPTENDDMYPAWMNAWNAKAAEIDEEIIEFFKDLPENTSEALENASEKLQAWWDKQTIDDKARAEFAELKSDAKAFKARISERVAKLVEEGRLKLAREEKAGEDTDKA